MPYTPNPRDFGSPLAAEGDFYKEKIEEWLKYKRDVLNSYIDGNLKKPCLVLGCGNRDIPLDTQTVLLLREALKKEPMLLDDYLNGWLVANADDFIAMSSSGSMKPKRRLGSKPKSTLVTKKVVKVTSSDQQVVSNISDAVDSALG